MCVCVSFFDWISESSYFLFSHMIRNNIFANEIYYFLLNFWNVTYYYYYSTSSYQTFYHGCLSIVCTLCSVAMSVNEQDKKKEENVEKREENTNIARQYTLYTHKQAGRQAAHRCAFVFSIQRTTKPLLHICVVCVCDMNLSLWCLFRQSIDLILFIYFFLCVLYGVATHRTNTRLVSPTRLPHSVHRWAKILNRVNRVGAKKKLFFSPCIVLTTYIYNDTYIHTTNGTVHTIKFCLGFFAFVPFIPYECARLTCRQ